MRKHTDTRTTGETEVSLMRLNPGHAKLVIAILILALSFTGSFAVAHATRWGPSAGTDTVAYIEVARSFAAGRGLVEDQASGDVVPLSLRPPLYPMLLGLLLKAGLDPFSAARWIDVVLFAGLLLALGLTLAFICRQPLGAIAVVLLVMSTPIFLGMYASAMSEALCLTLGAAGFGLLGAFLQRHHRSLLIGASIALGLAWLSRHGGLPFILAGGLSILLFRKAPYTVRLKELALYGGLGAAPYLIWAWWTHTAGGATGVYDFSVTNIWNGTEPIRAAAVDLFWEWLPLPTPSNAVPYRAQLTLLVLTAIALSAPVMAAFLRRRGGQQQACLDTSFQHASLYALLGACYACFIAATFLYVLHPRPALDERILSPLLLSGYLAGVGYLSWALDALQLSKLRTAVLTITVLTFLWANAGSSWHMLVQMHDEGGGYSSRAWAQSGLLRAVQELPEEIPLISSDVDSLLLFLDRPAYRIPELESGIPVASYRRFGDDPLDPTQRLFRDEGAALVLYTSAYWQFERVYGPDAETRLQSLVAGLDVYALERDGAIYFYPGRTPRIPSLQ